jgi:hypothetical protein
VVFTPPTIKNEEDEVEDWDDFIDEDGFQGNPNLKKAGTKIQFTESQVQEYVRCAKDPIYFIKNYCKIVNIDKGIINFDLYPHQEDMIKLFEKERFVLGRIARQSGKTTVVVGYIVHALMFRENYSVGIFANKQDVAIEILGKVKFAIEQLPHWLQQGVLAWNKKTVKFENGSKCKATATSASAGRSESYNLVFLDEFAFIPAHIAAEFFKSVYPTISSGKNTKVIIISTPNGLNHFYRMWMESERGEGGYKTYFAPWQCVPWRDEKWKSETIANTSKREFSQEYECVHGDTLVTVRDKDTGEIKTMKIGDLYDDLHSL